MAPSCARCSRSRAFTLVELLVVVGIIALLIAILLPSLNLAHRRSRRLACLSNLKQLGACMQLYLSDNRGRSFPYDVSSGGYYVPMLRPGYTQVEQIMICPDAWEPSSQPVSSSGITGNWAQAWTKFVNERPIGSYTLNGWLYRYDTIGKGGSGDPDANFNLPATESALVPVFTDGIWPNGWPRETDPVPTNLYYHDKGNMMGRYCIARHDRKVNAVFLDGHADNLDLAALWRLKWSRKFVPTTVTIP